MPDIDPSIHPSVASYLEATAESLKGFTPGPYAIPSRESLEKVQTIMLDVQTIMDDHRVSNAGLLLAVLAEAMMSQIAVTPVVIASDPGVGTLHALKGIADTFGFQHLDIRCGMMSPHDFTPLAVAVEGGDDRLYEPSFEPVRKMLLQGRPAIIVLDEAMSSGAEVVKGLLAQIEREAVSTVIVVVKPSRRDMRATLDAVSDAMGIERPLIDTCELLGDPNETAPQHPAIVVGQPVLTGSKIGERYFEMELDEPYPHTVRFTVHAMPGQDDDALNEALDPLLQDGADVAIALRMIRGEAVCCVHDMVRLKG